VLGIANGALIEIQVGPESIPSKLSYRLLHPCSSYIYPFDI